MIGEIGTAQFGPVVTSDSLRLDDHEDRIRALEKRISELVNTLAALTRTMYGIQKDLTSVATGKNINESRS